MRRGHFLQRLVSRARDAWEGYSLNMDADIGRMRLPAPQRWYLCPELERLYKQAIRDVQIELREWMNPWRRLPECCVADGMTHPMFYHSGRHEIWVHRDEDHWFRLIGGYVRVLGDVLKQHEQQEKVNVEWDQVRDRLHTISARLQERHNGVEDCGLSLSRLWSGFEQELLDAWQRCQQQNSLADLEAPYRALRDLYQVLQEHAHLLFIHELIHSLTKYVTYKVGKRAVYHLPGVMRYDYAAAQSDPRAPCYLHKMLDETITEWIAQQIYRGDGYHVWRESSFSSGYPAWIIKLMAQALDHEWEWLAEEHPVLEAHRIWCAEDLLYWISFRDPRQTTWLEDMLTTLTGEKDAFTKVSQACEAFTLGQSRDVEALQ